MDGFSLYEDSEIIVASKITLCIVSSFTLRAKKKTRESPILLNSTSLALTFHPSLMLLLTYGFSYVA